VRSGILLVVLQFAKTANKKSADILIYNNPDETAILCFDIDQSSSE
jgi:hypothetical protein